MPGSAARAHDEAEAERLAKAGLEALELPAKPSELTGCGKWLGEKSVVAAMMIRRRTGARNAWVADRLGMGTEGNVTRAVRRVRTERRPRRRLKELERMLEKRAPFQSGARARILTCFPKASAPHAFFQEHPATRGKLGACASRVNRA